MNPTEAKECLDKFHCAKSVHSILIHVIKKANRDLPKEDWLKLPELYEHIIWPLNRKYKSNNALQAFKDALTDKKIFAALEFDEEIKASLLTEIQRRLEPKPMRIRADFNLTCYSYEGINAIIVALKAGLTMGTTEIPIKVPPTTNHKPLLIPRSLILRGHLTTLQLRLSWIKTRDSR